MKKILYLCHRIPYPPNKGDKIRSFNEIRYLSQTHDVDLVTFADDPRDLKYEKDLKTYCKKVRVFPLNSRTAKIKGLFSLLTGKSISQGYFYSKAFQKTVNKWIAREKYHTLICFSSPMAEYVFQCPAKRDQIADRLIMDFCDLDSDKWLQYSLKKKIPAGLIFKTEAARLLKFEKRINQTFTHSIFVSRREADLFLEYFPQAENITVIPNGVDHVFFDPARVKEPKGLPHPMILFSGAMDYYANIDGVTWFAQKILPEIKIHIPDIRFYIVGSNPAPKLKALETDAAVTVTGFVKDIREYYRAADICVIPLRIARGVQNKVLEALAMEKAVVTTFPAVQGIHPEVGSVLQIEDDPVQLAQQTIRLLQNARQAEEQGRAARQFVLDHYNWENNLSRFFEVL